MSPALAHRDPQHNQLIESMAEQMVELVLQEQGEEQPPDDDDDDDAPAAGRRDHHHHQGHHHGRHAGSRGETKATTKTKTGISRIGTWETLDVVGATETEGVSSVTGSGTEAGGGTRVSAALSQSLALAQALSRAAPNPSSAPNYQGSFGYVEPPCPEPQHQPPLHLLLLPRAAKEFTPSLDVSFSLQGVAMTRAQIQFVDRCNNCFSAVLLLQR